MVTEDQVIAGTGVNRITGSTTENKVIARTRSDLIVTPVSRIGGQDPVDVTGIRIVDDVGKLVCISRLTVAVIARDRGTKN